MLVEKPFTVTAAETADLIALARERGLFAMEAMWTRFSPLVREVAGLVRDGARRAGGGPRAGHPGPDRRRREHRRHRAVHRRRGRPPEIRTARLTGHGFSYEAEEVARCLRAGRTESPVMPLDGTLAVMRTLDAARAALRSAPAGL